MPTDYTSSNSTPGVVIEHKTMKDLILIGIKFFYCLEKPLLKVQYMSIIWVHHDYLGSQLGTSYTKKTTLFNKSPVKEFCFMSIIYVEAIKERGTFNCNNKLKYVKYYILLYSVLECLVENDDLQPNLCWRLVGTTEECW